MKLLHIIILGSLSVIQTNGQYDINNDLNSNNVAVDLDNYNDIFNFNQNNQTVIQDLETIKPMTLETTTEGIFVVNPTFPQENDTVRSLDEEDRPCSLPDGTLGLCVPFHICIDGVIDYEGQNSIDLRSGFSDCNDYLEKCCATEQVKSPIETKIPSESSTQPIYQQRHCGIRNVNGAGFQITGDIHGEAQFGEFPSTLALLKRDYSFDVRASQEDIVVYVCGATLISPNVAMTAAHCLNNVDYSSLLIRAGEYDTQTISELYQHQDYEVEETIIHEHYHNKSLKNDIALLILKEPVQLAPHINTACIPHQTTTASRCFALGWGKDMFGRKGQYQVILKKIELPVVGHQECEARLKKTRLSRFFRLHESFMCAGGEVGVDVCTGDGGGPLYCESEKPGIYYQTGIIAWGIGCKGNVPGVYLDVAKFRNWIDDKMIQRGFSTKFYTSS